MIFRAIEQTIPAREERAHRIYAVVMRRNSTRNGLTLLVMIQQTLVLTKQHVMINTHFSIYVLPLALPWAERLLEMED